MPRLSSALRSRKAWMVRCPPTRWTSPGSLASRISPSSSAGLAAATTCDGVQAGSGRVVSTNTSSPGHGQRGASRAGSKVVRPITTALQVAMNSG